MSEQPTESKPVGKQLERPQSPTTFLLGLLRGICGAIVGGALGHFGFVWIATKGFYSLVLPGALLGLGFGLASQQRSVVFGVMCAIAALALGMYSEWSYFFIQNNSFWYFLAHVNELNPITWIMLVVGTLMAFWFGRGR